MSTLEFKTIYHKFNRKSEFEERYEGFPVKDNLEEFDKAVAKMIANGWTLHGHPVAITYYKDTHGLSQSFVRHKQDPHGGDY